MKYLIWSLTAALALGLSACGKKAAVPEVGKDTVTETAADEAVTPATVSPGQTPFTLSDMNFSNALINASVDFPEDLGRIAPALAKDLKTGIEAEFAELESFATEDKAERPDLFQPYVLDITWSPIVQSGDIISLERGTYTYTGGAHPNTFFAGLIYDVKAGKQIKPAELFVSPANAEDVVAKEVSSQIIAEKIARYGSDEDRKYIEAEVDENLEGAGVLEQDIALLGSSVPGKFGGLMVMYSPYEMGPYAEGSYLAVIPQAIFASELKPEYATLFDGEPVGPETD